jgi:acyl-homoserine-lactone acylase
VREDTLRVKADDGTTEIRILTVRSSVHGPVIAEAEGRAFALRVVGLDQPAMFRQYYEMLSARSLEEFEEAMRPIQIPMFTTMYADRDGHIMHLFNGRVPRRSEGDFGYWMGAVPGNTSATLWSEYHAYEDLPRVVDPASGWLQNANDPPWTTTFPEALDASSFPPYMAPRSMHPRAQRSARMLLEDESVSFEEMVEDKFSTRLELADRLLDDLIPAARELGGDKAKAAADILEAWDRNADVDSRGAVLFLNWAMALYGQTRGNPYAVAWDPGDAVNTPDGLANPREAVQVLEMAADTTVARHGAVDVAFGEVYRVRRDGVDLPGNGMSDPAGVFRAAWYQPDADGTQSIMGGDTFVMAVEFSDPIRAVAVLGYGNASQPGSPHRTDQLSLFSEKRVRPVLRTRSEIESDLERRTILPAVSGD